MPQELRRILLGLAGGPSTSRPVHSYSGWSADAVILAHPTLMNVKYYLSVVVEAFTHSGRPVLPSRLLEDLLANAAFIWRYDPHSSAAMSIALPGTMLMAFAADIVFHLAFAG